MVYKLAEKLDDPGYRILLICDGEITEFADFKKYVSSQQGNKQVVYLYEHAGMIKTRFPSLSGYPYEVIYKDYSVERYSLDLMKKRSI